jgi:hypothetical protein
MCVCDLVLVAGVGAQLIAPSRECSFGYMRVATRPVLTADPLVLASLSAIADAPGGFGAVGQISGWHE